MDSGRGSWNRYPTARIFSGNSPAHLDAWSKYRLGFVTPTLVVSTTDVTLLPAETDPVVYKMVVPNSADKEYFLFENRQAIGFDQGLLRFGTHGLAIYHVDDTVLTRNYWRPNEAENWKEFRSEGWKKAWTGETHYAISLIQADDRWDLEHAFYAMVTPNVYSSLSGDLYPGANNVTSFSSFTKPNSSNYYFWGGSDSKYGFSGVTVTNIQEINGEITATFSNVPWPGTVEGVNETALRVDALETYVGATGLEVLEVAAGRDLTEPVLARQPYLNVVSLGARESHVTRTKDDYTIVKTEFLEDRLGGSVSASPAHQEVDG